MLRSVTPAVSRGCGSGRASRFSPVVVAIHRTFPTWSSLRTLARNQSTSSVRSHQSNITSNDYPLPFDKILIANRGEIACRIIRTCRRLGIRTVAVYSVADGPNALHAQMADEAYLLGTGPTPAESYLRIDEMLHVAMSSGAQAIHPGYGFVSENANLAQLIQDQYAPHLCLVGPSASAMRAMGSKSHAKSLMEAAGVPTTPGYHPSPESDAESQDPMFLKQQAVEHIGFPLLIKAVMGGGGKGMRLVWKESEFLPALESCQRESLAAFGNSQVLLEKYLVQPRHVEVQVIADQHGNTLHLYERDCSLQRRHQKVLEEAPASDLPWELRQTLGTMATRAAEAVNYVNAGTVEFLLDTQQQHVSNKDHIPFYFCEMNTRLQVEHPVTESITGLDVVEWQLRIAAGQALPWTQEEIPCRGHAFEARIYAEQPTKQFLPATGRVWHHRPPVDEINQPVDKSGVRVDTGIVQGQDISVFYDPMISKLIVHGETRQEALSKLVTALQRYQIAGVPNNLEFLIQCAQHSVVQQAGAVTTGFLDDHGDDIIQTLTSTHETKADVHMKVIGAFVAVLDLQGRVGTVRCPIVEAQRRSQPWSNWSGSWRMGGRSGLTQQTLKCRLMKVGLEPPIQSIQYVCHRDGSIDVGVVPAPAIDIAKEQSLEWFHVDGSVDANGQANVVVNHTHRYRLSLALRSKNDHEGNVEMYMWSELPLDSTNSQCAWHLEYDTQRHRTIQDGPAASAGGSGKMLRAPMPGKITRLPFAVSSLVQPGDVVVVMEAMKMEHAIKATRSGVVASLSYGLGEVVNDGAILAVIEEEMDTAVESKALLDIPFDLKSMEH